MKPWEKYQGAQVTAPMAAKPWEKYSTSAPQVQTSSVAPVAQEESAIKAPWERYGPTPAPKSIVDRVGETAGDVVAAGRAIANIPEAIVTGAAQLPLQIAGMISDDPITKNLMGSSIDAITKVREDDAKLLADVTGVEQRPWEKPVTDIGSALTTAGSGAAVTAGPKVAGLFARTWQAFKGTIGAGIGLGATTGEDGNESLTETFKPEVTEDLDRFEKGLARRGLTAAEELAVGTGLGLATDVYKGAKALDTMSLANDTKKTIGESVKNLEQPKFETPQWNPGQKPTISDTPTLYEIDPKAVEATKNLMAKTKDPALVSKTVREGLFPNMSKDQADRYADQIITDASNELAIAKQAKDMKITPEQAEAYSRLNKVGLYDIGEISEKDYLTPEAIETALGKRARTQYIDRYAQLNNIAKKMHEAGDIKGSKDVLEQAPFISAAKNLSQNGRTSATSLIAGDRVMNYTDDFTQLVPVEGAKSLSTLWTTAMRAGKKPEDLKQVLAAGDALNDYDINRLKINEAMKEIDNNRLLLESLDSGDDLVKNINADVIRKDIKSLEDKITKLEESAASRGMDEATARRVFKYAQEDPVYKEFIEGNSKLNGVLLDNLHKVGYIDTATMDYLRTNRPNYVSAKKVLEEVGVVSDDADFRRLQGDGSPIKTRKGRGMIETADVLESQIRNIAGTMQAVEAAAYRDKMFKFLYQLPEDSWKTIFRESKADVAEAIKKLETSDARKLSALEITDHAKATIPEGAGNVRFNVGDGKTISLTVKDDLMKQVIDSPIAFGGNTNGAYDVARFLVKMKRDAITVADPTFSLRALQRESADQMVAGKAIPVKDYIPVYDTVKRLAKSNIDKQFLDNYAYNVTFGEEFRALNKDKQVERFVKMLDGLDESKPIRKGVEKTWDGLKSVAERSDMAPRAIEYEVMKNKFLKQGMHPNEAHTAAMRLAYELGVNYAQQGLDEGIAKAIRLIPFGQVGMNGVDRTARFLHNHPVKAASRFMILYGAYKALETASAQQVDPKTGIPYIDLLSEDAKKDIIPLYLPGATGVNDYVKLHKGWVWGRMYTPMDKMFGFVKDQLDGQTEETAKSLLDNSRDPLAIELKKKGITGRDLAASWIDYFTQAATVPTDIVGVGSALDIFTNKDYKGDDIVSEFERKEKRSLESNTMTSPAIQEAMKSIAKTTGIEISPIQAQYVLNDIFPILSQSAIATVDATYDALNDDYMAPSKNEGQTWPMKRVMGPLGAPDQTGYSKMFYNMAKYTKEATTTEKEIMDAMEEDPSMAEELVEYRQQHAQELRYAPMFDDAKSAIKGHFDTIDKIRKDPNFVKQDADTKRDLINEEYKKIDNIAGGMIDYVLQSEGDEGDLEKYRHTYGPLLGVDPGKLIDMLSSGEITLEEQPMVPKDLNPTGSKSYDGPSYEDILGTPETAPEAEQNGIPSYDDILGGPKEEPVKLNFNNLNKFLDSRGDLTMGIHEDLANDEGRRNKVYKDTKGIKTVGIGFNMESPTAKKFWAQAEIPEDFSKVLNGTQKLSEQSIDKLFDVTLENSRKEIRNLVSNFDDLSENQQDALLNMHFQLGHARLGGFKKMLSAINNGDFEVAALEAQDSDWAKQTPGRAKRVMAKLKA